ncbi:MAG: hypothetical protein H6718_03860 [Polyangiaceae bacterium]|nr:hypothetical protein [Myxococcales bacterium]MCB9584503.1 hypothetical protein [Polyangiaceae bacterium]MCB9609346.1 hypothetical protein [Polyangiaceae bacterium]
MKLSSRLPLMALVGLLSFGAACVPRATGPKIRVATATPQQLADAEKEDQVWYEFQQGDVIPVYFAFLGVSEGGSRQPVVFRAKQHFWFVTFKNGPMQISFDGKTFAGQSAIQSLIAVVPRKDGQGGQLGWIIYMGQGNPEAELKALIEQQSGAAPAQQ